MRFWMITGDISRWSERSGDEAGRVPNPAWPECNLMSQVEWPVRGQLFAIVRGLRGLITHVIYHESCSTTCAGHSGGRPKSLLRYEREP